MKHLTFLLFLVTVMAGCTSRPHNAIMSDSLPAIIPDYVDVVIPDGIAPLNFYMADDSVDVIDVTVEGTKGGSLHANGDYADFDIEEWHALTRQNRGDSLMVTVCARRDGQWTQYRSFTIYVSNDSLSEWGVTYRLIPPGYEAWGQMGIYQRELATFEETAIVDNRGIDGQCVNCHMPNRTHPLQYTFHVRGPHGATVVSVEGRTDVLQPRNKELGGGMVYPYWHPTGCYIAYSTNNTHQNFHQQRDRRVEVYDEHSDIILYDIEHHEILLDSTLASRETLENYPAFSPDGRMLYYCAAQRVDSIWQHYQYIKYDICRIAFDAETGRLIGQPDTVVHARRMGKSANMPRVSYDSRFLLYTLSDYGCFPIWHPEADLWMTDLKSGESYPLTAANSPDADSFHSWSLNSRWIVFTTRRDDGLYTSLYIAHVSHNGHAAKAFRLPQRNPREYDAETVCSFNTPDFTSAPISIDRQQLYQKIMSADRQGHTLIVR